MPRTARASVGGTEECFGGEDFLVAKLIPAGALDPTFGGGDGITTTSFTTYDEGNTVVPQPDGRILLAGKINNGVNSPDAGVIRLNPDGTLDTSFGGGDGKMVYDLGIDDFVYGSAIVEGNNRLLIAGAAVNFGDTTFNTTLIALSLGDKSTTVYTYSTAWQMLTEHTAGDTDTTAYVWGATYVDDMVTRDTFDASNGLTERIYPRNDANHNTTSIVGGTVSGSTVTWATKERYQTDPYGGNLIVYNNGWTQTGSGFGGSGWGWVNFFQGGRVDAVTQTEDFRNRLLDLPQGRWLQQDPDGYVDGENLYQCESGSVVEKEDPLGLTGTVTIENNEPWY